MFSYFRKRYAKTNNKEKGFSLTELIVVVSIMAVILIVLVPSLIMYVENTRKAKDESTTDELVQAFQMVLSDSENFATISDYAIENNFLTYSDSSGNYSESIADGEYWAPDGLGKAVTITYNPDSDGSYSLKYGIVNDITYGNGSTAESRTWIGKGAEQPQCFISEMGNGKLFANLKSIVSEKIVSVSNTNKWSSFTVFIKFSNVDNIENVFVEGSYNGTNVTWRDSKAAIGSRTEKYDDYGNPIPSEEDTGGFQEPEFDRSALAGSYSGSDASYKTLHFTLNGTPYSCTPGTTVEEWLSTNGYASNTVVRGEDGYAVNKHRMIDRFELLYID